VILRGTAGMAEVELLENEDAAAEAPGQPVRGRAAESAGADHDAFVCVPLHEVFGDQP
jgi:hypothetical protein